MHAVPGLACPGCRGDLRADGDASLSCQTCATDYPILDGIPSFVAAPTLPSTRGTNRVDLTVIIPAADQASNLDRLLAALQRELRSLGITYEILRPAGPGYGAALRTGFDQALGEYILTLDGDGSHDPSFVGAIWAAPQGAGVVIASRYIAGGGAAMPPVRQALSRKLRNSIASADYDARAYTSVVPLQRYWQRRRYQVITTMAAGASRVLDVGCGSSRIIGSTRMVGLDIILAKLRYARRYGNPLVHGSIFELPFKDSAFDCVICSEVIEHVAADERVFSKLERVLEPGGRLILGTPDYDRWRWRALEWLYGRLAPGGYADEHITHYSRANLAAYLEARGFTIDRIDYVGGSEMIFGVRKSAGVPAAMPLPIAARLRSR